MNETLKQTLDRLEQEIAQLKANIKNPEKQQNNGIDIKKEIEATVTIGFINNLYRNK